MRVFLHKHKKKSNSQQRRILKSHLLKSELNSYAEKNYNYVYFLNVYNLLSCHKNGQSTLTKIVLYCIFQIKTRKGGMVSPCTCSHDVRKGVTTS